VESRSQIYPGEIFEGLSAFNTKANGPEGRFIGGYKRIRIITIRQRVTVGTFDF